MSSTSEEYDESEVKVRILKTLVSINETAHKIKNELNIINSLIIKDGQLQTAMTYANKTLIAVIQDMNLNIEKILDDNGENNEEDMLNLQNVLSASSFEEKILKYLNNM